MSKFKVGDRVLDNTEYGGTGIITRIDGEKIYANWEGNDDELWIYDHQCILIQSAKQKPPKRYTETDRRKAAKAVRVAQAKLLVAVKRAKETGIDVSWIDGSAEPDAISMSYQPETPKKRVYK